MAANWIKQKQRYRQFKARTKQLPESYRIAIEAVVRYSWYIGRGVGDGGLDMMDDLADLFEQGAASGTPIREIVGEDPVEFAETFLQNYPEGQWITRERDRLTSAIDRAAGGDTAGEGASR